MPSFDIFIHAHKTQKNVVKLTYIMRIIFFTESSRDNWRTSLKMGNLYMNRFAIDEDAAFEVLKIFELKDRVHQTGLWSCSDHSLDAI